MKMGVMVMSCALWAVTASGGCSATSPPAPAPRPSPLKRHATPPATALDVPVTDGARGAVAPRQYHVQFDNKTDHAWTMVVFQTLPGGIALDSVSWQQVVAARQGTGEVSFSLVNDVVLATYTGAAGAGIYRPTQTLGAAIGSAWDVVFKEGVQQLEPAGTTVAGQIRMTNRSDRLANLGVGQSGHGFVYKRNVLGNVSVQFVMSPASWVGLFESVQLGQVVSRGTTSVGPLPLSFQGVNDHATLTASMAGESLTLSLTYGVAPQGH